MARKKSRKSVRRRSGGRSGARRGGAKQPPYALIGATVLLAGAGAYLFWPRTSAASQLPVPPPTSSGSTSPTSHQIASGNGGSAQSYAQQNASNNKNAAMGGTPPGPRVDSNGQLIDTSVGGLASDASAASNAVTNPIGAAFQGLYNWVTGS